MLFQLDENTARSKLLSKLNEEFLFFLNHAVNADEFTINLFSEEFGQLVWANGPTQARFQSFYNEYAGLDDGERNRFNDQIQSQQNIAAYFTDKDLTLPNFPGELPSTLTELFRHLFNHAKRLQPLINACDGECISTHFQQFRNQNGVVCTFCATSRTSQNRDDVDGKDQWVADYDHLLSISEVPYYGVHPDNLVPTCEICNRKAKGARSLLFDLSGNRQAVCYSYDDSLADSVFLKLEHEGLCFKLDSYVEFAGLDRQEMLNAWESVYQVQSRVVSEQSNFAEWIQIDCRAQTYEDLVQQITIRSQEDAHAERNNEWLFWKRKLYQWLIEQSDDIKQQLWAVIEQKSDDENSRLEFEI